MRYGQFVMQIMTNEFFQDSGVVVDPLYEKVRAANNPYCLKARNLIERMWPACARFIDEDAAQRATVDFSAVWWELYLAFSLSQLGVALLCRDEKPTFGKGRPDIITKSPRVWIEAVTPTAGEGPDALAEPEPGKVFDVPIEGYILRLRNSIQNKIEAVDRYIEGRTIPPAEPIIIAVSGARLPFRFTEGPTPNIVRAVLGVGNIVLEFDIATKEHLNTSLEYKNHVVKKSQKTVATDLFLHRQSERVSAILYCASDCVKSPTAAGARLCSRPQSPCACSPAGILVTRR
jgi:hypothetical protein